MEGPHSRDRIHDAPGSGRGDTPPKRILITGAHGFLGHHIVPVIRREFHAEVICPTRQEYDLLRPGVADRLLRDTCPDWVIHLAAKSGGILDNRTRPAEYFFENLTMNTAVFHAAWRAGVRKFVTLMGGCSYPADAPSPIREETIWDGPPQAESAPYALAKRMLLVQSAAYRAQYGFSSIVLIPGNVYGEWDNFRLQEAHVIPALIRKFVEAEEQGNPEVLVLGTGRPRRDFVYAGDVAALLPWFIRHYDSSDPVNLSTGHATSIRELAELLARLTGFEGHIRWDPSQPDGQLEKIFSTERLRRLGLSCPTPLEEGLRRTIDWFRAARQEGSVRL